MGFEIRAAIVAALVFVAWSRKSLTPVGISVAFVTGVVHAIHPWGVFLGLLTVFFLTGNFVTKVKHDVKANLTQSAKGASGGEGPRNHIQVLANSGVASVLILLHMWQLKKEGRYNETICWRSGMDVLVVGIVANYAAVAADTFSSELGILAKSQPVLITAPWRNVPRGTNGGITDTGVCAGVIGGAIIGTTAFLTMPFCNNWAPIQQGRFAAMMTIAGLCGTLLDSFLGAILQASVVDVHSGKIVEGEGGRKVLVHGSNPQHFKKTAEVRSKISNGADGKAAIAKTTGANVTEFVQATETMQKAGASGSAVADDQHESRKIAVGYDILDNNGVNILMAAMVSVGSMLVACHVWDLPYSSILGA